CGRFRLRSLLTGDRNGSRIFSETCAALRPAALGFSRKSRARRRSLVRFVASRSAAVAQAGGDAVDREVNRATQLLAVAARRAQAPQQLHLQVVQRIDVRDPVAQAAREERVVL